MQDSPPGQHRRRPHQLRHGAVYTSIIDANTWSPSAYPAGWQKA